MYDFPVWFDHIQMALFRVFVTVERETAYTTDENGDIDWFINNEENDCGIFLSLSMAKVHYDSISVSDFISLNDKADSKIYGITKRLEMWTIDECNAAEEAKIIEQKRIY